jgi:hypothetical protein
MNLRRKYVRGLCLFSYSLKKMNLRRKYVRLKLATIKVDLTGKKRNHFKVGDAWAHAASVKFLLLIRFSIPD